MRKNILILGHNYATQFVDIYNQYSRIFPPDQFEVTVAYLSGTPDDAIKERTLADHVVFFNFNKDRLRYLKMHAIRQLKTFCEEKQFQMVICHRYKASYIMMWVAQFYRCPALVFVMHELGTMRSIRRRLVIAALCKKNMMFAGVSNAVAKDIRSHIWRIPSTRVVTLYNMIDVDLTIPQLLNRSAARTALQLNDTDFIFGNVARLVPNKDQANLIHAFSLIKPYCPNSKLVIIGDGILADSLKKQVKLYHLENDVIFTGFLANGYRYMQAFDCFVLNSTQEAFGRVLLEAMLARIPVIATKVHGIPEVLGGTNKLVSAQNATELSAAMQSTYDAAPGERQAWGNEGYHHVLKNFSLPQFALQFWQLPLLDPIKES
ncbi:MAG: glycosyltransferase [Gammaproteobacteria bacterium]|nr:glycosyltransferase [Gammaproteobacteria bacterium]